MSSPEINSTPAQPTFTGDVLGDKPTYRNGYDALHAELEILNRQRRRDGKPPVQEDVSSHLDLGGPTEFERLYPKGKVTLDSNTINSKSLPPLPEPEHPKVGPGKAPHRPLAHPSERSTRPDHTEARTEAQSPIKPSDNVQQARQRLDAEMSERLKNDPSALAKFRQNMTDFEQRMSKNPNAAIEEQRTYDNLYKLLATPKAVVSDAQRVELATDMMDKVAHVSNINQGQTNACGPASMEARLYDRAPSQAVRAVEEVALTGKYTEFPNGHVITIDHRSITNHITDVGLGKSAGVEPRSLADQIFQTTAYNVYIDSINQSQNPPGQVRYEVRNPTLTNPSGEQLVDYSTKPPKVIPQFGADPKYSDYSYGGIPGFTNTIEDMYEKMSGVPDGGFQLNMLNLTNQAQFKAKLEELKREGKFPLTMEVDVGQPPFDKYTGGSEAFHFISIRDYDPKTGDITYTNGWFGSQVFHGNVSEMYRAMHAREDNNVDDITNGLKGDTDPKQFHDDLFTGLVLVEQQKRIALIEELSKRLGRNIWDVLTDEDCRRLGISKPNVFDRAWDGITGVFK